jgi:hypothetical protein
VELVLRECKVVYMLFIDELLNAVIRDEVG